ncbi:MAG: restriction endonuclease subunit S [Wenzhouxiangella sp.]
MSKPAASTGKKPANSSPVMPANAGISDQQTSFSAERLLELYDRVADAPDAVERLRRFVLDLAVRGKLVEQEEGDEPAEELLDRVSQTKKMLIKLGQLKRVDELPPVDDEHMPFRLPRTWQWVRLGDIARFQAGRTPPRNEPDFWNTGDCPWVSIGDMPESGLLKSTKETISRKAQEAVFRSDPQPAGTMIMSFKLTIGKIARLAMPAYHNEAIISIHPHLEELKDFLFLVLPDLARGGRTKAAIKGATLNRGSVSNICIPMPPVGEQGRIVAKVDELMALLNCLETTRTQRETTRDRLTTASLTRLTAPDTTEKEFPDFARFVLENLEEFTRRPDQIKVLRQTILNLAVRGKLVEQDSADEPASASLRKIAAERARLNEAGVITKQKALVELDNDDTPFPIPADWTWCRLGSLVLASDSGWSPKTENHTREGDAWGVLKVSAVSWDHFDPAANKQVLPGTEPRLQAKVRKGDFLISRANTAELVARAVLVQEEPCNLMMSDKIVRLRLATDCDHRFVWLVNNYSDYGREYYAANATGVSASMKNVSRAVILNLPVPLPPLHEQHRIVAGVDDLLALCDKLDSALTAGIASRGDMLEAMLHQALQSSEPKKDSA